MNVISLLTSIAAIALSLGTAVGLLSTAAFALDSVSEATILYEQGQLQKAAQMLQAELRTQPNNSAAHYLIRMGNILIKRGELTEAVKEYQSAVMIDPSGASGIYSKRELASLTKAQDLKSPAAALALKGQAASKQSDDSEKEVLRQSVNKTSEQTANLQNSVDEELHMRLAHVEDQYDVIISHLNQDLRYQLWYDRCFRSKRDIYEDPDDINSPTRVFYSKKIEGVKADEARKVAEITASYKAKSDAVEEAALNTDRQYLNQNVSTKMNLIPLGSNLHVHNYESKDEASGQAVTLLAEPAKLGSAHLKQSKSEASVAKVRQH